MKRGDIVDSECMRDLFVAEYANKREAVRGHLRENANLREGHMAVDCALDGDWVSRFMIQLATPAANPWGWEPYLLIYHCEAFPVERIRLRDLRTQWLTQWLCEECDGEVEGLLSLPSELVVVHTGADEGRDIARLSDLEFLKSAAAGMREMLADGPSRLNRLSMEARLAYWDEEIARIEGGGEVKPTLPDNWRWAAWLGGDCYVVLRDEDGDWCSYVWEPWDEADMPDWHIIGTFKSKVEAEAHCRMNGAIMQAGKAVRAREVGK